MNLLSWLLVMAMTLLSWQLPVANYIGLWICFWALQYWEAYLERESKGKN